MCQLQAQCPGNHEHEPYGRKRDSAGKLVYATADEAAYPRELAKQVVHIASHAFQLFPDPSQATTMNTPVNAAGAVSSAKQPRGQRMAPILSEFAAVTTISSVDKPPLDSKQRLIVHHGRALPRALNYSSVFQVGVRRVVSTVHLASSWIKEAKRIEHPFDVYHAVPDHLLRVSFDVLTMGPATIMKRRNTLLNKWISWAPEMNLQENQLKIHGSRGP